VAERYDVVVVGARCAGATLAHDLARAGLSVALVDRARFPSDTLSAHFFQSPGILTLQRLGLLDEMRAAGAPFIDHIDYRIDDVAAVEPVFRLPVAPGAQLCVRRILLDAALVRVAEEAGAHVRAESRVTSLVRSGERVTGVAYSDAAGRDRQIDATLVVGADGTGSTLARLIGARRYHVLPNQRFAYWGYFEGADAAGPPAFFFHRFADDAFYGFPCDAGLYVAAVLPSLDVLSSFASDLDEAFDATVARCEALAAILAGASRVGPLRGMANYPLYFRESAGPGWALVGDAGHFKDPAVGQGMCDAFRQAERLAGDIIAGLGGTAALDHVLADWWAWRDADAIDMHWLAADMGAAGPVPAVLVEFLRDLQSSPQGLWDFWGLFQRGSRPSEVLTPERFTAVAERVAGTSLGPAVMAELDALSELDEHRRRLVSSPCFVEDAIHRNKASELRGRPARSRSVLIGDAGRVAAS
jgi:2-polyprenyl-6-methoxyphenol hydroxylase-like FAD-dependent oxidoreductase